MVQMPFKRLGIGMIIFAIVAMITLTVISFEPNRNPDPYATTANSKFAVEGWKTAQNYDCVGCHTFLGNGAYFAPELNTISGENGPAWVRAWLDNPSRFPTESDVQQHLPDNMTLDQYYVLYPGAAGDVQDSGGNKTMMPHLLFTNDEKDALTSFLKYMNGINTNEWPPRDINSYSFSDTFEKNYDRWPESFDAWVGYWILGVIMVALIMFTFLYWQARGE